MVLKSADLFAQLALAITFGIGYIIPEMEVISGFSLLAYAVLQIISLVVHAVIRKKHWKEIRLRKIHLIGIGTVLLIMLFGLFKPAEDKYDFSGLQIIVYALGPAAAVALFYTVITYLEWRKMKKQTQQ